LSLSPLQLRLVLGLEVSISATQPASAHHTYNNTVCLFMFNEGLRYLIKADSSKAPVLRDVDIKFAKQQFDGRLLQENSFRKQGGPEVDAAWESLGINCMSFEQHRLLKMDF
jgi:hypothetical protein